MAQSRVALFLSVDIIMTMLTLAFVVLRVSYRWQKRRLNISDYLICAAMVWPTLSTSAEWEADDSADGFAHTHGAGHSE